jgi:Ras-related protein Rab-2A
VENEFKEDHDVTVGVEFGSYLVRVQDKILKLQIWDTAGQESFRSITKIFYRGAHAAILAYSVGMRSSFENLNDWLKEVRNSCSPDVQLFLIGNKSDISPAQREVTFEEALEFKQKNNLVYFTETSAKSGDNIEKLFLDASKFIYLKYKDQLAKMAEDDAAS